MSRTHSGPRRLKAGLPTGWTFLHKTGTGQDYKGMTAGYNDIGIATAPDGTRYAIVVMLGTTTSPIPRRMALMQAVSGAVARSEEHTSELQSLMRISSAVFCLQTTTRRYA